jgi:uncharacterized protein
LTNNRKRSHPAVASTNGSFQFDAVLDEAKKVFRLNSSWTHHGPAHWERVEKNAVLLAGATPGCDDVVARAFALLHDCCRRNEGRDPEHGARAAGVAQELADRGVLRLDPGQLALLNYAMRHHTDGQVSDDPTIGVCWDADRLDLPRVGIAPSAGLLSTKCARERLNLGPRDGL